MKSTKTWLFFLLAMQWGVCTSAVHAKDKDSDLNRTNTGEVIHSQALAERVRNPRAYMEKIKKKRQKNTEPDPAYLEIEPIDQAPAEIYSTPVIIDDQQ